MAFIPWEDGCKIVMNWDYGVHYWKNVFCFVKASFSLLDMTALADMFIPELRPALQALMPEAVTLHNITATDMTSEGAAVYTTAGAGDHGTSVEGDVSGLGVAVVVTMRTPLRGRSYRGRSYFNGLAEGQCSTGIWLQAAVDEVLDQYEAWQAVALGLGWTLSVASTRHNGVVTTPAHIEPVTSMVVRSLIPGSQRKRFRRL